MKHLNRKFKQLIYIVLVISVLGCSTQSENQILIEELERDIPILMDKAMIPGASIAVIKNGMIIWSKDFGVKNMATMEPIAKNAIYSAASLTKAFFAYLVMKLVDKGELDLDKPLVEYIPIGEIANMLTHPINEEGFRKEWLNKITARMVLSHTAGFSHGFFGVTIPYPLRFEPGTEYYYSADGYGYLQKVIEHIRNEPLDTLMINEVIIPLKMNNSSMVWKDRFESNVAYGHNMCQTSQGEISKSYVASAAAGLYTTSEDYAKFMISILDGTEIKESTIADFLKPQFKVGENASWSSGYGIAHTKLGNLFWHTGDINTCKHFFVGNRNDKSGIVFLSNSHNGLRIRNDLVKITMGLEDFTGINSQGYEDYNVPDFQIIQAINNKGMEDGKDLLNKLVQNNSEDGISLIRGVGIGLMNCKKYNEAIEILKEGTKLYPESSSIYSAIAGVCYRNGDYDQAIDNYKYALSIDNDNRVVLRYMKFVELTKILLNRDFDSALEYYGTLLKEDPSSFNELNMFRYGNRLLRAGRVQDAIEIFKVNLHFHRESSDANLSLGDAYAANNQTELALKYIQKALEISPGNGWAKRSLSKLENK